MARNGPKSKQGSSTKPIDNSYSQTNTDIELRQRGKQPQSPQLSPLHRSSQYTPLSKVKDELKEPVKERYPSRVAYYTVFLTIVLIAGVYAWTRLTDPRRYIRLQTQWTWVVIFGFIFLTLFTLQKLRKSDPGTVDRTVWDESCDVSWYHPLEKKANLTRRFCRKTRLFKPDRAHFCRTTNRLIKRYDHHCIFVDSSIGHGNHKYFMLFMFYAGCAGVSIALEIFFHGMLFGRLPPGSIALYYLALFVLSIALGIAVWIFGLFHVFLIATGYTTLEYTEKKGRIFNGQVYATPYSTSLYRNFSQVFGSNILTWLLPTKPNNGDGIFWDVIGHDYGLGLRQPPTDIDIHTEMASKQ